MKQVILAENVMEPETWERVEVEDLCAFLVTRFTTFPETARIYHEEVSQHHDVTPGDEAGIARLGELPGPFYVVVYPGDPITLIIAVVAVVAGVAASLLLAPQVPPIDALRNTQSTSPNNALSDRGNKPRPNGRIPDIYGTVRSTPDLLAFPYKVFQDHQELEVAYMCVGRGEYDITDVRDDVTPVSQIAGTSVEVYAPETSPNYGTPQLTIGSAIDRPLLNARRSNSVNGQVLAPPGGGSSYNVNCQFQYPNVVEAEAFTYNYYYDPSTDEYVENSIATDLTQYFEAGTTVTISAPEYTEGLTTVDLSGTYLISALTATTMTLSSPGSVNGDWNDLDDLTGDTTGLLPTSIYSSGDQWIGPFTIDPLIENLFAYPDDLTRIGAWASTNSDIAVAMTTTAPDGLSTAFKFTQDSSNSQHSFNNSPSLLALAAGTYTFGWRMKAGEEWIVLMFVGGSNSNYTQFNLAAGTVGVGGSIQELDDGWYLCSMTTTYASPTSVNNLLYMRQLATFTGDGSSGLYLYGPQCEPGASPSAYSGQLKLLANFVALSGMYKDDGNNQFSVSVSVELEVTPVDRFGVATGSAELFSVAVVGSATEKSTRAITLEAAPSFNSRCKVRARRVTPKDVTFKGTVVDEVKWRDLFAVSPVTLRDFGNVTTVLSVTQATEGALAVKDRKLNMLATRKIPIDTGSGPSVLRYPTRDAGQIFLAISRNQYIGARPLEELDVEQIVATMLDIEDYFGTAEATEFSYTFDNANMSYEETANIVASAVFCTAFRRGSLIKLSFEQATEDSSLLFNHRNKTPGSETRTVSFGRSGNYDGVAYEYIDPVDDALVTLYVPQGSNSALKPRKIESLGVRSPVQAHLHAWRAWNKVQYQNTVTEFEATQEAELVLPTERVLVADNTRADTWDGEVVSQNVLQLRLSQPFVHGGALDHTLFLQLPDGTVQATDITAVSGVDPHLVTIADAPTIPLALDEDNYARTTYMIQGPSPARPNAFLITEKDPQGNFTVNVKAVNYDARYYSNDQDFA